MAHSGGNASGGQRAPNMPASSYERTGRARKGFREALHPALTFLSCLSCAIRIGCRRLRSSHVSRADGEHFLGRIPTLAVNTAQDKGTLFFEWIVQSVLASRPGTDSRAMGSGSLGSIVLLDLPLAIHPVAMRTLAIVRLLKPFRFPVSASEAKRLQKKHPGAIDVGAHPLPVAHAQSPFSAARTPTVGRVWLVCTQRLPTRKARSHQSNEFLNPSEDRHGPISQILLLRDHLQPRRNQDATRKLRQWHKRRLPGFRLGPALPVIDAGWWCRSERPP